MDKLYTRLIWITLEGRKREDLRFGGHGEERSSRSSKRLESSCVLRNVYRSGVGTETVKISPKFQVVIPRRVRESLGIQPGQKVQVIRYENQTELIPIRPVRETRGFLEGIDTDVEREPDRV